GVCGVAVVAGIHVVVAQEFVGFTVPDVDAGPGSNVDDGARVTAIFRAKGLVIDLEFIDRVDGGLEGDLLVIGIVQIDAIDHEVDRIFTAAGGVKREGSLTAQRDSEVTVGGTGNSTYSHLRKVGEV